MSPTKLVEFLYPYKLMLKSDGQEYVRTALEKFDLLEFESSKPSKVVEVKATVEQNLGEARLNDGSNLKVRIFDSKATCVSDNCCLLL